MNVINFAKFDIYHMVEIRGIGSLCTPSSDNGPPRFCSAAHTSHDLWDTSSSEFGGICQKRRNLEVLRILRGFVTLNGENAGGVKMASWRRMVRMFGQRSAARRNIVWRSEGPEAVWCRWSATVHTPGAARTASTWRRFCSLWRTNLEMSGRTGRKR